MYNDVDETRVASGDGLRGRGVHNFVMNSSLDDTENSCRISDAEYTHLEKLEQQVVLASVMSIAEQSEYDTFNQLSVLLPVRF